ncbi:MAG TPA: YlmC/YmxH family sporulation protein [Patescibacteria group bacterium]|jgi:YlmC/YmxH family sporulation protein|nr:YlmC/YmxH family sporulation protein [Clostridia bacterium]HUV84799.1 YlmC/YmxH family sporulation protein [Methanosarcinales archaeon]HYE08960.1 YlmC/YmxH family sporulation protein [Patescibacteria group bacterium]
MRFSKLSGKEIVSLPACERLGFLGDCDLTIDEETGRIKSLIVPENKNQLSFFIDRRYLEIPWDRVRKIGNDMIIIDFADILK